LAGRYRTRLAGSAARMLKVSPEARHVYHLMVVRVPDRGRVQALLAAQGVQSGVHYPVPCHQQPPLRRYASRRLPVVEQAAGELLSLPLFPHMTGAQVDRVCAALDTALKEVLDDVRVA
jgi:dTDP-4-amino-4,6-dideoxygalactose transaminase